MGPAGCQVDDMALLLQADPSAGLLLSPMCLWLAIASVLVYSIWDINPSPETGLKQPLVPVREA